ncbi:protein ENHANCED DOWNY MILDEW 2 isoform X3 [Daucus carota subsp. sativus]|uniref:protein ENHANCED DOWNY MILDEW 2 isoform X3 n=1 Tax=Daucus carota subsp. sativus TaxID=79200 RepID=UPI0007EFD790|nr:PREDICTED: protein ENHANCED DOWNY MILDEW 2-like [Daucus carota subsp. sativus]XP_017227315.1 PREDICTED: protein ENHANCED DOWNY MILDEW 2-like [Daucus carota subsp. sativus]XP_017227324.1 PREDICTED: protein ENHANCED DOWNY MILDEW 2-like [Daucus carota subsp. sativus]XP_017227333.1 PREDICTED: protein ENHANCED DOWNY MILDEW 2-like [Daucus carota subsp. sativus]
MASSDDEGEPVLHSVTDYNFVDGSDDPVSFSELPVQWSDGERTGGKQKQIFMHGSIDNGLQKIYKQAEAWKFELSNMKPEISLLISKENNWMKLEKPRKSHENIFRTILITLQSLHFLRRNPEASGRALCEHLCKVFRFEPGPCENDLVDHASLISEAVKRDEGLAKAKILTTFLDKDPKKWNFFDKSQDAEASTTTKPAFIVDDDIIDETEEAESDDEEQGDKVCAICDNGGDILCCEGKCLRSFHATEEAGLDSDCVSLGFSDEQVEAIQNFYCKNCRYKCHQCFSCGKLGSSDDKSSDCEVFRCVSGECGRFYHPHCVSKLLHPSREFEAKELEGKISSGASFTCPFHKCCVCKQTETEGDPELRFAMCRRCPKSYHKKCLPREIVFDGSDDADDVLPRAWEKLMPKKRILIYCLEHEIDEELATPLRNHIKFPNVRKQASEMVSSKEKVPMKKKDLVVGDDSRKRIVKPTIGRDKVCSAAKQGVPLRKGVGKVTEVASSRKTKVKDLSRKPLSKTSSMVKSTQNKRKPSLGLSLFSLMNPGPEPSEDNAAADGEHGRISTVKSVASEASGLPPLEADSESRILALMKDATSSITLSEITEKHKVPTTHAYSSKHAVDRTITMGKVEGSVEALREAVKKLEEGGSIEDAKAVCGPGLLNEMMKWKSKLRVYLAPFLHGMRYTSFGRHFTKIDKLEKVVDKLHWYAEDGDMIVDFCCGANDFSCLMKKKLEDAGKKCYFKNYDVMQPKNDFNFEKRDWMTVDPNELPSGSKLIMGLNPPFGVKSALANKFIDKALKFRPKLIALIVPPETERLDTKDPPYDLVFEDSELLAGKSFYLPGSVDVNDKQMDQWNAKPPPLSFWSRKDWTDKHHVIAKKYGDLHTRQEILKRDDTFKDLYTHEYPPEDKRLSKDIPMQSYTTEKAEQRKETATSVAESHKEGLLSNLGGSGCEINDRRKNQFDEKSIKKCGDENQRLGSGELLQEQKWRRGSDATSLEDKQKKRGSSGVLVEDKQKLKASGEMLQEDKKKIGGSGESSLEKLRQRGPVEVFSEDRNKIGESVKRSVELRKTRTDEISMDKKRKGSHDISPDGKNKRREINEVEVRHDRRGSHEISPDDKKIKGSYEMSPEVRQKVIGSRELSPIGMQNSSFLRRQYQPLETTSLAGIQPEKYQHFDVRVPGSQQFGARYDGVREDAMPYRYEAIHDNHYQSSLYENRISEAQFPGYQREGIDYHGYMPHIENPPCQRSGYFGSHDPRITTPYENFGPATNLSYNRNTTSATQRYAPRLDELNQPRANNIGPDPAFPTGGVYDPRAPRQYLDPNGYPPGPYFRQ